MKYLLDNHFPGNKSKIPNYKNRNYQASYEDWEIADKIVTEERVRWAISLFAPFKSPGIDTLCYAKTSRLGRRKCQSTTRAPNNVV